MFWEVNYQSNPSLIPSVPVSPYIPSPLFPSLFPLRPHWIHLVFPVCAGWWGISWSTRSLSGAASMKKTLSLSKQPPTANSSSASVYFREVISLSWSVGKNDWLDKAGIIGLLAGSGQDSASCLVTFYASSWQAQQRIQLGWDLSMMKHVDLAIGVC